MGYFNKSNSNMTGKSMPGTNSRTILISQALMIGTATADADGKVK